MISAIDTAHQTIEIPNVFLKIKIKGNVITTFLHIVIIKLYVPSPKLWKLADNTKLTPPKIKPIPNILNAFVPRIIVFEEYVNI